MARAWIGTSGFDYAEWKPGFYPEDLKQEHYLQFYATRLDSVELDHTFYRMPNARKIEAWKSATPPHFRFALKASRKITHQTRLATPSEALDYLIRTISGLGPRLGVLLFQLPPFLRCDCERLVAFLRAVPPGIPSAFEFRHDSWLAADVYRLLQEHGAALCISDADSGTTPLNITSGFTYIRLRRTEYPPQVLEEWQTRIRNWTREGIEVFAYIKHEGNPEAAVQAARFARALQDPPADQRNAL